MALKRFEIMRELVPQAKQMIIPYMKNYPIVNSQLKVLRQAFKTAGLKMIEVPAKNAAELESVLKKQTQLNINPDTVLCITEPLAVMPDSYIVIAKFAAEHNIPLGGAMSFGGYETIYQYIPQPVPQGRQAAFLADKILKGTPAGTIPVVSAECFLTINYRAAKKLGLKVNESLLNQANEIIR
jgi:putative ABC transport system substrate-binding protein